MTKISLGTRPKITSVSGISARWVAASLASTMRAPDPAHPAGGIGDGGLAEDDRAAAAEDAPLGKDRALGGGGEEAHVEIERRLPDAAGGRLVNRGQRAADGHVDERAHDPAVDGRP